MCWMDAPENRVSAGKAVEQGAVRGRGDSSLQKDFGDRLGMRPLRFLHHDREGALSAHCPPAAVVTGNSKANGFENGLQLSARDRLEAVSGQRLREDEVLRLASVE